MYHPIIILLTLSTTTYTFIYLYIRQTVTDCFDDQCALLTVLPFSMVLLSNLWNTDDYNDRRIFAYEREKGYYLFPLLSPLTTLLADIIVYKLVPPILVAVFLYPLVGLRRVWSIWFEFLMVLCLLQVGIYLAIHCVMNDNTRRSILFSLQFLLIMV